MAEIDIIAFMGFYFGVSIALIILTLVFKTIIKRHWFLYLPLGIAGIVFFPFGLVMFGYLLRGWDDRRYESKFYAQEELESLEDSEAINDEVIF